MTFVFEMKSMPLRARARCGRGWPSARAWRCSMPDIDALARRHKVPPSAMSGAVQAVAMASGTSDEIGSVPTTLAGPAPRRSRPRCGLLLRQELANADSDLECAWNAP